jgi:hypothetical protein
VGDRRYSSTYFLLSTTAKELTGAPGIRGWVVTGCGVGIVGRVKFVTFGNLIAKFVQSIGETEWDTHTHTHREGWTDGRTDGQSDV